MCVDFTNSHFSKIWMVERGFDLQLDAGRSADTAFYQRSVDGFQTTFDHVQQDLPHLLGRLKDGFATKGVIEVLLNEIMFPEKANVQ